VNGANSSDVCGLYAKSGGSEIGGDNGGGEGAGNANGGLLRARRSAIDVELF
jgi:hypothetical protein